MLRGGAGLFAASGNVTREEWRRYVARMELDASLPGILGMGYVQMVPPGEKAAQELTIRAQGFPHYRILPEGQRDLCSGIVYIEPFTGRNLRAFGYDMYSEPVRREAMDRARHLPGAVRRRLSERARAARMRQNRRSSLPVS